MTDNVKRTPGMTFICQRLDTDGFDFLEGGFSRGASKKKGINIVFYFQHCSVASTQPALIEMLRIAQSTLLLHVPPSHFYQHRWNYDARKYAL